MSTYDLILTDVSAVLDGDDPVAVDIGVKDGKIVALDAGLPHTEADRVISAGGKVAFPGVVDGHQHWGIYNPLPVDAYSESRASAQGGVTTALSYMRTGQYYLNKGGAYADFFPEVLSQTEGKAVIDYAYHLAPMSKQHISEIPALIAEHGVTSFKVFMFYGSHGLHGRSDDQSSFLMTPPDERYDYAHFEFVMRGIEAARQQYPELADIISLSLHCETAEIMSAYTKIVEEEGTLSGLEAYHASRPPHSEGLAVSIASYLAHATGLPTINLLHLTSQAAVEAALIMAKAFPHIDFRREVTIGHLLADCHSADQGIGAGVGGKVNPPLRPREDVEALWGHVLAGEIDWVVSRPRLLQGREEVRRRPRRRVPGEVGLRRGGVPPRRDDHRRTAPRPVARGRRPTDRHQPGHALRPGRDRRVRCGSASTPTSRWSTWIGPGPCGLQTRSRRRSTRRWRASR